MPRSPGSANLYTFCVEEFIPLYVTRIERLSRVKTRSLHPHDFLHDIYITYELHHECLVEVREKYYKSSAGVIPSKSMLQLEHPRRDVSEWRCEW